MITTGTKAPEFTLPNTELNLVSLSDYKGKNVVLLFFPLAYTSVCTDELCKMRDEIQDYNNLNAAVLGVSVDSPYTLKQFKNDNNLNFDLLSDFNKVASPAYGSMYEVFGKGLKGVSKRSAFVIDSEGIVKYAEVLENAGEMPDFDKIKASLA
jgi:peroxiredoxin